MYREWKKIEFPKKILYTDFETNSLRGRPRNRWQNEVRWGLKTSWWKRKERVYNREEWKKLLRTARNCRILHVPMEWMKSCKTVWEFTDTSQTSTLRSSFEPVSPHQMYGLVTQLLTAHNNVYDYYKCNYRVAASLTMMLMIILNATNAKLIGLFMVTNKTHQNKGFVNRTLWNRVSLAGKIMSSVLSPHALLLGTKFLTLWRRHYFFLILAHSVYKMWIIQEPNKLALWNKLQFEEKKTESIEHV